MVLKDLPEDIPKMDSCPFCVLAKLRHFPYKDRRTHLTHGDLVGPMSIKSVSKYKYSFILMDNYSRASWVLL